MTEPTPMSDDELTSLLASVADDGAIEAPNRSVIRERMLAEADRVAPDVPVRDVATVRGPEVPRATRRYPVLAVAAALVAAVVVGLVVTGRDDASAPAVSVPVPSVPTPTLIDGLPVPSELAPGAYRSSLAGGITFDLLDPVVLDRRSGDTFTLSYPADSGSVASVDVIDTDTAAFRTALSALSNSGDVRVDEAVYREGASRLDIIDRGSVDRSCQGLDRCEITELGLTVDRNEETIINYVEMSESQGLVVLERFADRVVPAPTVARQLIETIRPTAIGVP